MKETKLTNENSFPQAERFAYQQQMKTKPAKLNCKGVKMCLNAKWRNDMMITNQF
jgi:hypothetical protein